jgi:alkanesulfonate monooxygenase SsuD/methylene tetrahydromethanopterin reductase-like flavin-dependent oxidoreductase (luciferase family)
VLLLTEFGVHLSGPVDDPRRFGELCEKIEAWRFDSVWMADGPTRNMPEPFPLLACASAFTERIKLGTCVYVLPLRHPLITTKLSSTLYRMSKGRLVFGIGVGRRKDEFRALGVPFTRRGRIADECLEILQQGWTNGAANFQEDFFKIAELQIGLQPEQKPHPPI